jgi:large subunit ribosomal protein L19
MKNKYMTAVEQAQIDACKTYSITEEKDGTKTTKTNPREIAKFQIGDTLDIHQRILEGVKERIQVYSGVVISRRGEGTREMITVRRIVQGEGVERIFPLTSPKIAKIEVKRTGEVRRAKLYYLRKRVGKATRLRERVAKEPSANGTPAGSKAGESTPTQTTAS